MAEIERPVTTGSSFISSLSCSSETLCAILSYDPVLSVIASSFMVVIYYGDVV